MIIEGERVKALVAGARSRVVLCSPFIKAKVFAIILDAVPTGVPVRIVTRWRPDEIAAGLSDLEVFRHCQRTCKYTAEPARFTTREALPSRQRLFGWLRQSNGCSSWLATKFQYGNIDPC